MKTSQNSFSQTGTQKLPKFVRAIVVGVQAIALLAVNVAVANADTFHKTKMIDGKGHEEPVELGFDSGNNVLTVKAAGQEIFHVPYSNIQKMSYELASRHRIKEGAAVMILSLGAGGVVMLTKSNSHWFYVDYESVPGENRTLMLKLDKGEYKEVLAAASKQTGKTVETLQKNGNALRPR